jgi:hypothetical protein
MRDGRLEREGAAAEACRLLARWRFAADCHWLRLLGSINAPSGVS